MDRQYVQQIEAKCIEEQPPACTTGCPIHLDARSMMEHARKGDFSAGFGVVARFLAFPSILSRICDHPCELVCKRSEAGEPLHINAIERACVDHGFKDGTFPKPQRAQKKRSVAIVGAGLSGLSAAVEIAVKGHAVTVFEQRGRTLDRVRDWMRPPLPEDLIERDLLVLGALGIEVETGVALGDALTFDGLLQTYDAIYLGLGSRPAGGLDIDLKLDSDERIVADPLTFATSNPKVFAGGCHRYGPAVYSPITSVHDGRYAALSIDRLFQGASLSANRDMQEPYATTLYTNTSHYPSLAAVAPADIGAGYTPEEAMAEAERCFPCHCLECVRVCDYLAHYGAYPKRYVREVYNNDCIVMGAHKSNRMANSCSLCGLCEAVCPEHLPLGRFLLESRQSMVSKDKMQPSFHDFALRDMAFSTSDAFSLARHQPGTEASAYVFFPGCQLSGSHPDHVSAAYGFLTESLKGGVGLMLDCCGAPAWWAGQEDLFQKNLDVLARNLDSLGSPQVVTACSTCHAMLKERLPQARVTSLWSVLDEVGLPATAISGLTAPVALHDPCTTRDEEGIRTSVRKLLGRLGIEPQELNAPGHQPCCGFGGLASFVNPDVWDKTLDRRADESEADYLTYCAMCRDNFARRGKRSLHILDLIFGQGADGAGRSDPGFSRRQENRARLKHTLLKNLWNEATVDDSETMKLTLSPDVAALAEKRLILLSDVRAVIAHAEASGEKFKNKATGHLTASHRLAAVTYWVEYSDDGDGYSVHNVYSHRMTVTAKGAS